MCRHGVAWQRISLRPTAEEAEPLCNRFLAGTPTPNTPDASVDKLQPLLAFLQHQPYGSEPESWKRAVQVRCKLCGVLQFCLFCFFVTAQASLKATEGSEPES